MNGDADCISQLLDEPPQLEHEDMLTLWFSIFSTKQSQETSLLLHCFLDRGIDPEEANSDSVTALHMSCCYCLKDCVELLVTRCKEVIDDADVFGMLPLHHAISMCKAQGADDLRNSSDSLGLRSSSDFSSSQQSHDLPSAEAIVGCLLNHGANVNVSDSFNQSKPSAYTTPLCFASEIGNMRVVEMLLKAGANVNPCPGRGEEGCPRGCTPLLCALDNIDIPLAELLMVSGADCHARISEEHCLIHHFCQRGNVHAVKFLLDNGVSADQEGSVRRGTDNPLRVATNNGFTDIMELLLLRGASVCGDYPIPMLTSAVYSGNPQAVRLLLHHGACVNDLANVGVTALYAACIQPAEIVQILLEAGADPNLGQDNHKPINNLLPMRRRMKATDQKLIIRELLWYNMDPSGLTKDLMYNRGRIQLTLMQRAFLWGDDDIVHMLLKYGASLRGITQDFLESYRSSSCQKDIFQHVSHQLHTPYTLAQQARLAIRKCFSYSQVQQINQLPLPAQIVEYLLLKDL